MVFSLAFPVFLAISPVRQRVSAQGLGTQYFVSFLCSYPVCDGKFRSTFLAVRFGAAKTVDLRALGGCACLTSGVRVRAFSRSQYFEQFYSLEGIAFCY